MDVMIPAAFAPVLDRAPLCVLARAAPERLFRPDRPDQVFRDSARRQYEQGLLVSRVAGPMPSVAPQTDPGVYAARRRRAAARPVGGQAVYDELRGMEPGVSAALARDSAGQAGPVIEALGATLPPLVPGYRARVIDGNHLGKTEGRLKPLRQTWAAAPPGRVLAVYDRERDVVGHVVLTPGGRARGRSLSGEVLPLARPEDLWVADRDSAAPGLSAGLTAAGAALVVRQPGTLEGELSGGRRPAGRSGTGAVYEQ